jgi:hypothetical protein
MMDLRFLSAEIAHGMPLRAKSTTIPLPDEVRTIVIAAWTPRASD